MVENGEIQRYGQVEAGKEGAAYYGLADSFNVGRDAGDGAWSGAQERPAERGIESICDEAGLEIPAATMVFPAGPSSGSGDGHQDFHIRAVRIRSSRFEGIVGLARNGRGASGRFGEFPGQIRQCDDDCQGQGERDLGLPGERIDSQQHGAEQQFQ